MRLFNHTDASKWSFLASFNFVDYCIVNGTDAQLSNVNAGGIDVPARSVREDITLTDLELAAVLTNAQVAVLKDNPSYQAKRAVARTAKYRKASTGAAL